MIFETISLSVKKKKIEIDFQAGLVFWLELF